MDVGTGLALYGDYGLLTDDSNLSSASCVGDTTPGPEAFFKVLVQPNDVLSASVVSYGGEEASVYVFTDCTDPETSCLSGAFKGTPRPEAQALWFNDTGAVATVFVAADSGSSTDDEPFGLFLEMLAPQCQPGQADMCLNGTVESCNAAGLIESYDCLGNVCDAAGMGCQYTGDTCADAAPVNPGGSVNLPVTYTYTNVDFSSLTNALNLPSATSCTGFSSGGSDAIFSVDLAPGQTVEATLASTNGLGDEIIYVLSSCDVNTCLQGADEGFGATAETVIYTNATGAFQTVLVVADLFSGSAAVGDVTITVR